MIHAFVFVVKVGQNGSTGTNFYNEPDRDREFVSIWVSDRQYLVPCSLQIDNTLIFPKRCQSVIDICFSFSFSL